MRWPPFALNVALSMIGAASCQCTPSNGASLLHSALYNDAEGLSRVFRGKVLRDVSRSLNGDGDKRSLVRVYLVQVERVIRGCRDGIQASDRVLVASHSGSVQVGLTLQTSHVFLSVHSQPISTSGQAALGNRAKAHQLLWTDSYRYNRPWNELSATEREMIQSYHRPKCGVETSRRRR